MPLVSQTTADHVMAAVEAIVVNGGPTTLAMIAEFLETTQANATAALEMAAELGLVSQNGADYITNSPLSRFTRIPDQKAAVLRILIESYRPFTTFRDQLLATADLSKAAQSSKTFCAIPATRDVVKETLISLGTYSGALVAAVGGHYQLDAASLTNALTKIASSCTDMVQAEGRIRDQLGPEATAVANRENVIVPLADALFKANQRDPDGAVQQAGNAVESHIVAMAGRMTPPVSLAGASGIVQKLNRFGGTPRRLPMKLVHVGEYLGAIRNAADHGAADPDIPGVSWQIRDATGLEYVFVACSFIAATVLIEHNKPPEI
jgi:hypothetical protein